MKEKILQLLEEADGFVSGQQLCEALGVSRTAVWKAISALRADGYEIEAVTNRGYRLCAIENADVFNGVEIERRLRTKWVGRPLFCAKETGSTNNDIQKLSDEGYGNGTLCVSEKQTAGKGRRGRTWISPSGGNVYMSILLKPSINPDRAPMTTLIMALAVFRALEKQSAPAGVRFGIKWPNDGVVSVDGGKTYKKIVGILTEMRLEEREIKDITIGTGLNINIRAVPPEVRDTAATIADALGRPLCRAALVADIWNCFEEDYEKFLTAGSLKPLKADYERGLVNAGRRVRVLDPKGEYEGTALGISDTGELLVRTADDKIIPVSSGEISVRGVMGYV